MTLEQLVTDLATSQQLRDKGFPQDTAFKWCRLTGTETYSINTDAENYYVPAEEVCAAPTAGELEEWLLDNHIPFSFEKGGKEEYGVKHTGTENYYSGKTLQAALTALVLEVAG